jgi:DNA-binding IclR family transcriptional regulator
MTSVGIDRNLQPLSARRISSRSRLKSRNDGIATAVQEFGDRARGAGRAFEVLEFFREHCRPARTAEIGRALGIPNSSADDLLKALQAEGYLTFNAGTKHYAPAYRIIRLAEEFMAGFPMLARIHDFERFLHDETGQTVVVAARQGKYINIVSVVPGACPQPEIRIGCLYPLARYDEIDGWAPTSNFAGALLAASTDLEIVDILSDLEEPGRLTDFNPLLDRVRRSRARGVADCELPRFPTLASCSAWLERSKNMPTLAVGCVGYAHEFSEWRPYFDSAVGGFQSRWMSAEQDADPAGVQGGAA